jgi:hypothetical protein
MDSSRHHIVPRSRDGSDDKNNIVRLEDTYHRAFHRIFQNMAPDEQIERVLDIAHTALEEDFRARINDILQG